MAPVPSGGFMTDAELVLFAFAGWVAAGLMAMRAIYLLWQVVDPE